MVSTSTINCGSTFGTMGWQLYTDILQDVYIQADKKLSSTRLSKQIARGFFASLSQETIISIIILTSYVSINHYHTTILHGCFSPLFSFYVLFCFLRTVRKKMSITKQKHDNVVHKLSQLNEETSKRSLAERVLRR